MKKFSNKENLINQFLYSHECRKNQSDDSEDFKILLTDFLNFLIDAKELPDSSVDSVRAALNNIIERKSLVPVNIEEVVNLIAGNPSVDRLIMGGQNVILREKKQLKKLSDGTVLFGTWPQDENGEQEEIEWIVLDATEKKILLITKKAIWNNAFNENEKKIWEDSDIRRWLNTYFYQHAFSDEEKEQIYLFEADNVFLLSVQEVKKFIPLEENRRVEPTAFAVKNGVGVGRQGTSFWWLRSAGVNPGNIACVDPDGVINFDGFACENHFIAVRPVMWIMKESI